MNKLSLLLEIFDFQFMVYAFFGGTFIGLAAPIIGQFMVTRRYANIADSLAHIALLGITTGLLINQMTFVFGIVVTVVSAMLIEYLRQHKILSGDTGLVLFTATSLSLVAIIQQKFPLRRSLEMILFGSVLNLTITDIVLAGLLATGIVIFVIVNYKQLLSVVISYDLAKVQGINVQLYNYILIALAAITVTISLELIGGLLISGIMIIPVISARLYSKGFVATTLLSVLFSISSVWSGLIIAWLADLPSGATIVAVSFGLFCISYILGRSD